MYTAGVIRLTIRFLVFTIQMTFVIRGWICLVLACALMVAGTRSWQRSALGSVRQAHYYYEGSDLKGICVATDDGAIAMLDHKTGEIVWRNYPEEGRRLHRFIPEGRCTSLLARICRRRSHLR